MFRPRRANQAPGLLKLAFSPMLQLQPRALDQQTLVVAAVVPVVEGVLTKDTAFSRASYWGEIAQ